jgi:hypothetical protein
MMYDSSEAMAEALATSMSWFLIIVGLALVSRIGLALYDRWRR